ncbi:3-deoxy-D-manno-octulosonic acid transferase [Pontibaca salina]|uniref:3-deoxy-D-manno-octulosonic acid transferase n=1 Tax=Pontibaca salina TaxID=2795731 RepID=A0A934LYT2_9RHOB|nr:3-deoxy-D-manno-octulosonic acid transferase [Pontibaca salina]MBI6630132.1 3-deoxy-D-manno-octulosonic acid transferase [Pontibaca salina]
MSSGRSGPTPLFRVYRAATGMLAPLAWQMVSRKLRQHDVSPLRMHERLGNASQPRPLGRVIWFHAASVGESLSVLTLIARMGERLEDVHFLITSGTATSARLIAQRLPARCLHQFAPLDAPGPVGRFLSHWQPDAGVFVESELWPVILTTASGRGIPLALLNARLSQKSVTGWRKRPRTARFILDQFSLILTQNRETAGNLRAMGANPERLRVGTNLKAMSAPLPVTADDLTALQNALSGRKHWLASSTHAGEEETVLAAHRMLLRDYPQLCLMLMPRHPERGDAVAALIAEAGLTCRRRSQGALPDRGTQVYLADTLGETGTFYALCPRVFLGGSLRPIGGHNPFEPAQAGAAVASGPNVNNFSETYSAMTACGAATFVEDASSLAGTIRQWLDDPAALESARDAAREFTAARSEELDAVVDLLCETLRLGEA